MLLSRWFRRRGRPAQTYRPHLLLLEDRITPSGAGPFGHLRQFSPPGPATHLQVIVPEDVQVGQTFDVLVTAKDASNHIATGFTDAISLTATDATAMGTATPGSALALLPLSYTFTASDHGIHEFQVTLTALGSQPLQASDTTVTTVTAGSASTIVNPAPTLAQLIVVTPETAAVGVPTPVKVYAVDASGHRLRNFTGTVSLMTSDTAATGLPPTYMFLASDHGKAVFMVTFETADTSPTSPTTVTATAGTISGQAALVVDPATQVTHFAIHVERYAVAGSATAVVVKALNASNQVVPGYTGTVSFTSSDTTATISDTSGGTQTALAAFTYVFTSTDAGIHTFYATFGMTAKQSLTVSDNSIPPITGTTHVRVRLHSPWSSDSDD